jgi:hypothetical protein
MIEMCFQHLDFPCDGKISDIINAIRQAGCCVIRNVGSPQKLEILREKAVNIYQEMDQKYGKGILSPKEIQHCYRYGIIRPFEDNETLPSGQEIRSFMLECVLKTRLKTLLIEYLGIDLQLLIPSTHIRRQSPIQNDVPVPFHQDSSVMNLLNVEILNFWFPLDVAGRDRPTVELIPIAQSSILPFGMNSDPHRLYSHLEIGLPTLKEYLGDYETWSPVIHPGDVLIIQSKNIHRTQLNAPKPRMDFELRFCRTQHISKRIDIKTQNIHLN